MSKQEKKVKKAAPPKAVPPKNGQPTPVPAAPASNVASLRPSSGLPLKFDLSRTGEGRGGLGQLARAIGKSETMLSLVLNGKKVPPVLMLVKMAGVLSAELGEHVTVDQILRNKVIAAKIKQELAA